MLPSGSGDRRALGAPSAYRYEQALSPTFPPKCTLTGRVGGSASPSLYKTLHQGSPLLFPHPGTPPSSLRADSGEGVPCCLRLEDLALTEVGSKVWSFLVPLGEAPPPVLWALLRWPCSIPLPDSPPHSSPVPPLWLPGLETFFGKQPLLWGEGGGTHQGRQVGSPVLGT